jgi:secretory phospholipase A2
LRSHLNAEANGCGPKGMQVEESFGLVKCCNRHDICYWLCNTKFAFCEKKFKQCMTGVCKQLEGEQASECKQQAQSFSGMTQVFGSGMHAQGQGMQCDCLSSAEEAAARHRAFLMQFYESYNVTAATDEHVDSMLEKYKGKEGEMYYLMVLKYGLQFVKFDNVRDEL